MRVVVLLRSVCVRVRACVCVCVWVMKNAVQLYQHVDCCIKQSVGGGMCAQFGEGVKRLEVGGTAC